MNLINFLKDIIAPKKCISCEKEGLFFCEDCLIKNDKYKPICYICKTYSKKYEFHELCLNNKLSKNIILNLDKVMVLSHYRNKYIRKLVLNSKFYSKKDILTDFGHYLSDLLIINEKLSTKDYIVLSVPMYFLRKISRGYNQSDLLAREVSKHSNLNFYPNILKRIKNTKQQSKLDKKHRLHNLDGAFKVNKKLKHNLQNKTVVLVDDVISTGTTLNYIAKILKENGASRVIGLCIASG